MKALRHWPLWPVNSPHKWPVTRKMFLLDDVIMEASCCKTRKNLKDKHISIPSDLPYITNILTRHLAKTKKLPPFQRKPSYIRYQKRWPFLNVGHQMSARFVPKKFTNSQCGRFTSYISKYTCCHGTFEWNLETICDLLSNRLIN